MALDLLLPRPATPSLRGLVATTAVLPNPRTRSVAGPAGRFAPTSDPYRNIIALLMVFTLSRIHQNFAFMNKFHPALVLVALAGLYALMNPRYLNLTTAPKAPAFRRFTMMGAMACISVPFGISMGNSAMFIITEYSKVILFAFLVLLGVRHARDLYKFIWAFAISGGCLAYLGVFVFRMQVARGDDFERIQSGFSYDSNDIGLVCGLTVVFALLIFQVSRAKGKLAAVVIIAGLGSTIGRTGSRGALLTLGVVVAGLVFLLPNVSIIKKIGFVIVSLVAIMISAPPGYWDQMATMITPTQDYNWTSETGRKEVFLRGLGYMSLNPVTGIGINNFPIAEGSISDRAIAQREDRSLPGIKWSAAHNSFLQTIAELGITGFLIFATMIFGSVWECRKLAKSMPKAWIKGDEEQKFLYFTAIYLPIALLAFSVGGCLVSFAYIDPVYVMVALVGGLNISVAQRLKEEAQRGQGAGPGEVPAPPPQRYRGGLPPRGVAPNPLPQPVPRS